MKVLESWEKLEAAVINGRSSIDLLQLPLDRNRISTNRTISLDQNTFFEMKYRAHPYLKYPSFLWRHFPVVI